MNPLVKEKLRVNIFGRQYELDPGNLTPLEASQLAGYVDQKMKEIAEKLGLVDTQKIAVLAALNIAFELGSQRKSAAGEMPPQDEAKLKSLLETLEKALNTKE
jgi:cell division protein ZapA (FtsZ GTPase activity inhibitor)